jgi:hypothetical protein
MSNPRIEVDFAVNVAGVANGVSAATSQLDKLGKAAQATAPKVEQLGKATSRYNGIGIDFARVIQDAPFGIIGVGNNIQQLSQSFSALGQAGDSTMSKLKTAFGAIFSSGNLLVLAVSAITAAWTYYEKNAQKAETVTDKTSEAFKELSNQIDKTATTLGTLQFVDKIVDDQLVLIESTNKTSNIFDSFGKATEQAFEKLNVDQLTAVKKTFQELAGVQIQKLGNQLGFNRKQVLEFVASLKDNDEAFEKLDPNIRDSVSSYNSLQDKVKLASEQLDFFSDKTEKVKGQTALEKYSQTWDDFNLGQETARELQEKLKVSSEEYEKQIIKVLKTSKEPFEPIITGDNAWDQYTFSVYKLQQASFEANKEITVTSQKALEFGDRIKGLEGKEIKIKTTIEGFEDEKAGKAPFEIFLDDVALQLDKLPSLQERVANFAKATNDLIKGNVTDAFVDLGYTIGETLATGGNLLTAIGGSLLKSFGRFLGQFGQQLIAYGVAASAFGKVSLALTNPATAVIAAPLAIAAGIALTAIAGAIGSIGSKGPGGGGGGGGAGGGSSAQGSTFTGGGAQGGLFAQNRDVSGEFVVRGNDLVYVLGQANNKINKG